MKPPAHDRGLSERSLAVPTNAYVSSGRHVKLQTHTLRNKTQRLIIVLHKLESKPNNQSQRFKEEEHITRI